MGSMINRMTLKRYIDMKQLGDIAAMLHYLSAIECFDLAFEFAR